MLGEQAGACAPIGGATEATYGVSGDDVLSTLRADVTAHDAVGTRTVLTDATDEVEPAEADAGAEIANTARPSIDGEARAGLALVAQDGGWDAGDVGLTFRYRWWACDTAAAHCERIESGDGATFTPTTGEVAKRLRVMVTAVAGDASATIMSAPTDAVRPPHPTAVTAPALWGDALDGAVLSTDAGVWVPDNVEIDEHWQRCDAAGESCADIADTAGVDYWLTPDDIGHTVRAVVTATNGDGTGTAYSPVSDVIAPQPPTSYWQPSFTGMAREDGQLTADPGGWGGSPELSYAYAWQRCDAEGEDCAPISGATAQTYNLTSDDLGLRVRVEVTATNVAGSASSTSEPSDVVDGAAVAALDPEHVPAIDGDAHDGQVLTADPGGWSGSDPLTYTYVWERCDASGDDCAAISGATDPSYVLTGADVGATVRFVVTVHNPTGTAEETTAATDVVAVGAPVSLAPPTIDGEWHAGGLLVAAPGRWGGTAPATYAYQWRRCDADGLNCADLDGETTDSYTLTVEDAHQTVAVAVTATNAHGTETATSDSAVVGGLVKPANVTAPTLDGTAHTGQWLVADPGSWDNEPDEYRYTWDVCDAQGENCFSLISDSSFYLDSWYAGRRIRVTVTAADGWDEDPPSASSALTDVIGSSDPVNLTPPAIADETPMVGRPLAVATGDWVGDAISYLYQWRRCRNGSCSDVFGANAAVFTPRYSDIGYTLQVRVTGYTSSGTSTVTTAASRSVGEGAPFGLEAPSVSGQTVVGAELQSDAGSWSDYWNAEASWQRCDASGDACVAIPDSDGWYYRTTRAGLAGVSPEWS